MKKVIVTTTFSVAIFLLICLAVFFPHGGYANALNFEEEVLEINSLEDFKSFATFATTEQTKNKTFVLNVDLDLSSEELCIGTILNNFNGVFDGNGHTLNISVDGNDYAGLFGYVGNDGVIKSLTVTGSVTGQNYSGGIAGYNSGLIYKCKNSATVSASTYVGGIVGYNTGTVDSCINAGNVVGSSYIGGIVGETIGTVSSSINTSKIVFSNYGGGIVGRSFDGILVKSVNIGEVAGTENAKYVGGIVGELSGMVADCYNYSEISASGLSIGSCIGHLTALSGNCGRVYNVGNKSVREVVGDSSVTIPTSFTTASVYSILAKEEIFASDAFVSPVFEVGYGYLDCPAVLVESNNGSYLELLRVPLFSAGNGTEENPFVIADNHDWNLFCHNILLYDYEEVFVKLNDSLTLGNITPIGKTDVGFKGNFDGNGKTVEFECTSEYGGLFYRYEGNIKNLTLATSISSSNSAGGLATSLGGSVQNVTVRGNVSGNGHVGGIAGIANSAKITNCNVLCTVVGNSYVGGVAGSANDIDLSKTIVGGSVLAGSASSYSRFGGVCGEITGGFVEDVVIKGEVSSYKASRVGGVFGTASEVLVNKVLVLNNVTGRRYVGGIFGYSTDAVLENGGVVGNIYGSSYVGGICGMGNADIAFSYFNGDFGTVSEASIDLSTFRTIAQADATLSEVYYNSDIITDGTDGIGKSYVGMTIDLFADDNENWYCCESTLSYGVLPIITFEKIYSDVTVLSRIRCVYFGGGTGSEINPFVITTEQQYRNTVQLINMDREEGYFGLNYKIGADIGFTKTVPSINNFEGTFDGNFKSLTNVVLQNPMFVQSSGTVKNVAIESGRGKNASIVGTLDGKVVGCYSFLNLSGEVVGGIVTDNYGTVSECVFVGRIENADIAGGIVARNFEIINNCSFNGYVEADTVGGLCGYNEGDVKGVVINGIINGLGTCYTAGGFFGLYVGHSREQIIDSFFIGVLLLDGKTENVELQGAFFAGTASGIEPNYLGNTGIYYSKSEINYAVAYYFGQVNPVAKGATYCGYTSSEMVAPAFIQKFTQADFVQNDGRDYQSDYAPINSAFNLSASLYNIAKKASAIGLFGRDYLSDKEWGSNDNPYLISASDQLDLISENVRFYDYEGKYFKIIADLDFNNRLFRPIGEFVGTANENNRIFNGIVDGDYHTISGLNVNSSGYVGLFGYTGYDFVVKNLLLDDSNVIVADGYGGSIVGYNRGTIHNVISFATVSGSGNIGGIVGYSENNTTITDTVFAGTIPSNGYGITSQRSNIVNIDTTNTKYLIQNDGNFVLAGKESYIHNDYGDVLFVDVGGYVSVSFVDGTVCFTVTASDISSEVRVMTSQDVVISIGESFGFESFNESSVAMKYYVRFTYLTKLNFIKGEDKLISTDYGQGYFYVGQVASYTIGVEYGYFIWYDEEVFADVVFGSVGERVIMSFTVAVAGQSFDMKIEAFEDYYTVATDTPIYDGNEKTRSIDKIGEDLFKEFEFVWSDSEDNRVDNVINAGTYTAKIRLIQKEKDIFLGVAKVNMTVLAKEITLSADEYWSEFAVKYYDESKTSQKNIDYSVIVGIIDEDVDKVVLSATVEWDSPSAGKRSAKVYDFVLSGSNASNYYIVERTLEGLEGEILTKLVEISIAEEDLTGSYDGNKPILHNVIYGSSIGNATITWNYYLLTEEGNLDDEWNALDNNHKTWYVGSYLVVPSINNYNYELSFGTFIYCITPQLVHEITYSGYNGLVYTGEDLSSSVKGVFVYSNGSMNYVSFYFYDDNMEATSVVDAGNYTAVPYIPDKNYDIGIVEPLTFEVSKAIPATITFSLEKSSVVVGERLAMTISDTADAILSVETVQINGESRGKAVIEEEEGQLYFVPTKYPFSGKFYFRIVSYGSKNYEDGSSIVTEITVLPGTIYVGMAKNSQIFYYGAKLQYSIVYSRDYEQNDVIDKAEIDNLVEPDFIVDTIDGIGVYRVTFMGGSSDGYDIETSKNNTVTIERRAIRIVINEDMYNGKTYGDEDGEIRYKVTSANQIEELTVLPDGTKVVLNGSLGREEGEDVGMYLINAGTLDDEHNKNYTIEYGFTGRAYEIVCRHVSLVVEEQRKQYGSDDPMLTFTLAEGSSFAKGDDGSVLFVAIAREQGERVGSYRYYCSDYDGGRNYIVDRVDVETNKFFIDKVTPSVVYYQSMLGTLRYGDRIGQLTLTGYAVANDLSIDGEFRWKDTEKVATKVGNTTFDFVFVPKDSINHERVNGSVVIDVQPRIAEIIINGSATYIYNGRSQGGKQITATVGNALSGDKFDIKYTYDNQNSTDVGSYFVYVSDLGNEKYIFDGTATEKGLAFRYEIQPATCTVEVADARIKQGSKYTPKISYVGLVNGETESVITKKAVVVAPTEPGVYSIKAEGAEAKNYRFEYALGELVIERLYFTNGNITMQGEMGVNLSFKVVDTEGVSLSNVESVMDRELNYNLLLPNAYKVREYYELRYNGKAEGEFDYTVELPIKAGDKIYVKYYDGGVVELTDYEIVENDDDTATITFTAEQISAIAVYEAKDTNTLINDYIPLLCVIGGVVVVMVIIVLAIVIGHKKAKREREYLSQFD